MNQRFSGFTQWLAPSYAQDTNPKRWYQESIDLSTLPGEDGHPTLLFYIFGEQSVDLSQELAVLQSEEEKRMHLANFFRPYYSLLPHFESDSADCTPSFCLATNWLSDEYAGHGSYSTFRTGLREGDRDIEIMREGLPGRGVWVSLSACPMSTLILVNIPIVRRRAHCTIHCSGHSNGCLCMY